MIFGTETPFHLKRLPRRGMRQIDGEVVHHYPGYVHPVVPTTNQTSFMCEEHRLHPYLTVDDELRHERREKRERDNAANQRRHDRVAMRNAALQQSRDDEFESQQRRAAWCAGTNQKNMGSENRDVITHRCHSKQAQEKLEYRDAVGRYSYHHRQKALEERNCPTGFNIITWEPRQPVRVPPLPTPPQQQ